MHETPISTPVLTGDTHVALERLPEGHLLQVMGAISRAELEARLSTAGLGDSAIRDAGYRQWYVVGDRVLSGAILRDLSSALPPGAFLSDQSHGRVRMRLSGAGCADVLAKGTAVDLHPSTFREGQSAFTLFGHISVHLTRLGLDEFELAVPRSFADAIHV